MFLHLTSLLSLNGSSNLFRGSSRQLRQLTDPWAEDLSRKCCTQLGKGQMWNQEHMPMKIRQIRSLAQILLGRLSLVTMSKNVTLALFDVAQLVRCNPTKQKVTSLITSQGTCLDCGFGPEMGLLWEAVCLPRINVSLSPFPLKINK